VISPAHLRVGSLEILAALAIFGVAASLLRTAPRPLVLQMRLRVFDAPASGKGREIVLHLPETAEAVLGRSSECDLPLPDPEVSRRHARLQVAGGAAYLTDLGSSNGTFLNGKPTGRAGIELKPGDDIDVGNTRIRILQAELEP
jgi:predicted component of type VI protein secretion system